MQRIPDSKALPAWWVRAIGGIRIGLVVLGLPWLLILVVLAIGGRYQFLRRIEIDFMLLAVVYPIGPAITGLLLGVLMPLLRRPIVAIIGGMVASVPWFALISLVFDPHGPQGYSVDWFTALLISVCLGPVAGATAHDLIPVMRKRRQRSASRIS